MDFLATCPFCHLSLPPSELQRHANSHFDDEDGEDYGSNKDEQLARDLELVEQLSLDPSSIYSREEGINRQISLLIGSQIRGSSYHIKDNGGIIALLCKCLELDAKTSNWGGGTTTTLLSGYVDHFQSMRSEDVGWGCGWRNIQMLSSHLLSRRWEAREVLFGGCGFVPDIPFLQRWLEIAWERGFDTLGSYHFNQSVYGSRNWIGTTECAALFRSFGLRARIVDFGPKELESFSLSVHGTTLGSQVGSVYAKGKRKAFSIHGPMDRYLTKNHQGPRPGFFAGDEPQCSSDRQVAGGADHALPNKFVRSGDGHQILLDWVWNYFSGENIESSASHQCVTVTDKAPLYFQHDGHSRTIVGIQVNHQKNGKPQFDLLILDPAHRTATLEVSLKEMAGWKNMIKRGLHTLKKPQYQLCYVDNGIASGEEKEQLKTIDSVFIEF